MTDLSSVARAMTAPGKGLLAADESVASADKRLASYGIATGAEVRRRYRDLFLATPGIEQYLSGVILFEETATQSANDGTPFTQLLGQKGILPGIKVDQGTEPFPGSPEELITKGLVGLPERLAAFAKDGMRFTKWRAVIRIDGDKLPTAPAVVENAKRLAAYAHEAQLAGMVPMLEPEVLLEGKHSRVRAKEVIEETMKALFMALADNAIDLSGVIVKTSMALTGSVAKRKDAPDEVAADTLDALLKSVPPQVPGIVFLSGGQEPDEATENLRAISRRACDVGTPWPLTFSYARALQHEALSIWKGEAENVPAAREAYIARLRKVSEALAG